MARALALLSLAIFPIAGLSVAFPVRAAERARDGGADAGDPWQAVARRISAALTRDPRLADEHIDVHVSGLLVTLRGTVSSEAERERALDLARRNAEPYMVVYDGLRVVRPRSR